jgi:hypothetical protein
MMMMDVHSSMSVAHVVMVDNVVAAVTVVNVNPATHITTGPDDNVWSSSVVASTSDNTNLRATIVGAIVIASDSVRTHPANHYNPTGATHGIAVDKHIIDSIRS